ncbi:hypothetical protein KPH14_006140 [Odynerus spinipes]|uniref:EGF-like domain-containing protein n=1 Tax=Odynerus spinipes TaxID=1348599 RepID=A0AAD9VNK8_9HYME|nr:hypothetical protein KPH14_006140 [Odynerus spinipes]
MGIQNDRTSSRSSQEDLVLSASSYTGPERTFTSDRPNESLNFQRTAPAFRLETSKSIYSYEKNDMKDSYIEESIDQLTSSKHVDHIDGNNIEVKPGEYYRNVVPTTSHPMSGEGQGAPQGRNLLTEPHQPVGIQDQPVPNLQRIDQPRQARQEKIYSEHAPPPILQTALPGRQANPDIQDIITGIVKLLNGNVNVAANTVRPLRPVQATRINNRGPPRISDVPPLPPDFDTPGMNPPPPPDPPYPFDKPPSPDRHQINQLPPERPLRPFLNGVPLPEQIVPPGNRPWSWNRPGGNRRPIPPYKPLPPNLDSSFHRDKDHQSNEKPIEKPYYDMKPDEQQIELANTTNESININDDITTSTEENANHKNVDNTRTGNNEGQNNPSNQNPTKKGEHEDFTKKIYKYQSHMKDKINNDNTLVLGAEPDENENQGSSITHYTELPKPVTPLDTEAKDTKITKTNQVVEHSTIKSDKDVKHQATLSSTSIKPTKSFSTSTLNVETSSSVQVIESSTATKEIVQPTATSSKDDHKMTTIVNLEPSTPFESEIRTTSATPTDSLPTTFAKASSTTQKNLIHASTNNVFLKNTATTSRFPYLPRPGIVLDDTLDYTGSPGLATQRPYPPQRTTSPGDIFDVTVSAIQGPGGSSGDGVRVSINGGNADVILTSAVEGQGFVSIDGKRTYLNLFDNTDRTSTSSKVLPQPTRTQPPHVVGTGLAIPQPDTPNINPRPGLLSPRPNYPKRPTQPPVRIDTCIVGDSSTCDASQHEACATVQGVSACHCKPGFARLTHSLPCKKIVSIVVSIRIDRFHDTKVSWNPGLADKDSETYQALAFEANRAIGSAMSMTPFSDEYIGSSINSIYQGDVSQGQGGVFVNATLKLAYESRTVRPSLAGELQKQLLGVIHRRSNNIGNSVLYVDSPRGSISNLQDLDECASSELNDCHSSATCTNNWGGFTCSCNPGLKDPHKDDPNEAGRSCLSCPSTHCNNRGTCSYQNDQMHCSCTGNYYGTQCEVDGEVLGVAIGASVAALIIIVLTLVCLVMWSRRWSREQKSVGSPVYGYIQGGIPGTLPGTLARVGSVGTLASVKQGPPTNLPPYMWAHFGEHMATANLYATEPMGPTRPSSAMFGYPPINVHGTLPPVPLPRLQAPPRPRQRHQPDPDSSDSEPQDKDRADLIPHNSGFHVPRPKSRSSLANQSGIYNDVEYDQGDVQHLSKNNIPMSTYRPYYRT